MAAAILDYGIAVSNGDIPHSLFAGNVTILLKYSIWLQMSTKNTAQTRWQMDSRYYL